MSERGSSAFIEPSLPVPPDGFAPEVLDVLAGERSVQDWVHVFAQLQSIGELEMYAQMDILNRVDKKMGPGPTPMKFGPRRPPSEFEARLQSVAEPEPDSWSEVSLSDLDAAIVPAGGDFTVHLGIHWNNVVKAMQSQFRRASELEASVKQFLEEIDDKIVMVSASLGKPTIPATTAWSVLGTHEEILAVINVEFLENMRAEFEAKFNMGEKHREELQTMIREGVFPIVQDVFNRLEIVSGKVAAEEYARTSGRPQGPSTSQAAFAPQVPFGLQGMVHPSAPVGTPTVLQMMDMMEKMQAEHRLMEQRILALESSRSVTPDSMPAIIEQLIADIEALKKDNLQLRMEMRSDAVSFGGHFFPTLETVEKFVTVNLPSGYYGFCYDFVSLLECYSDRNRDSDEGLSQKHKMGKAGYNDSASARIDQSFGCVVPMLFGKDEETNNPSKKLTALTSALIWENNRSGIKVNIDNFITNHRRTVDTQIIRMFGASSVATLFFQQMIHKTEMFWVAYSAWVTKFEREMTTQHGSGDKTKHRASVWNLVCWITHSMFVELNIRRAEGSAISTTTKEGVEKCASILQGALGAHKFMNELIEAGFIRHPIFSATMHEFLLANKASTDAVEDLTIRMAKVEVVARSAQGNTDRRKKEGAAQQVTERANK